LAASLPGSFFEIDTDANLKINVSGISSTAGNLDWASVDDSRQNDSPTGSGDNSFVQGTKEDTAVPTIEVGGIPPNKSDLKTFGVFTEKNNNGTFLHLFWSRVQDPSGTTNMDFELNQSSTLSANGVTPVRTTGDLLITYDLSKGGTGPVLSLRTWSGTQWGAATDLSASGKAIGSINSSPIPVGESDGLGALDPRTFGEASVNLTSFFPPNQCLSFGKAYLKSRSSDSFTAALKDFVPPVSVNVSNCGSITIIKQDEAGNALAGAEFTLYVDNAPVGATRGSEDTITTQKCTTTIQSNGEATCTIQNVFTGHYWVVETVTPSGHTQDADLAIEILADEEEVLIFVNPRVPAAVTITKTAKNASLGGDAPLSGVTFTLYTDNAPVATFDANDTKTGKTCTTTGNGTCSITNVLPAGNYCVVESPRTGYSIAAPQCFFLTLGQTKGLTFTNDPLSKVTITFNSLAGSGVTRANPVTCTGPNTNVTTTLNDSGSLILDNKKIGTYTCTIVIDP
jgi:hypothetical protein